MGDRAGNFAVQNSDLLLVIGSRMSTPQVGYDYNTFARDAKKIVIDIDEAELKKPSLKVDLPIHADAKEFMTEMLRQLEKAATPNSCPHGRPTMIRLSTGQLEREFHRT